MHLVRSRVAFRRYVALARSGRWGIPSILAGFAVILPLWIGSTLGVIVTAALLVRAGAGDVAEPLSGSIRDVLQGRTGTLVLLVTVGLLWIAIWAAIRLVHGRPLATLFGVQRRIDRGDVVRALVAACLVYAVALPVGALASTVPTDRSSLGVLDWLGVVPPLVLLVAVQASAEELLFRGYLVQLLGNRFASPVLWAVLPLGLFTIAHWDGAVAPHMLVALLGSVFIFGAVATLLVVASGNLGAAIGYHVAHNVAAFLIVAPLDAGGGFSLFTQPSATDPRWTTLDAAGLLAVQAASSLCVALLLLHPRSPLRLAASPPPGCASRPDE